MEKKYTLLLVMLTLIIQSSIFAQQDSTCPPDLVHYWKFDEDDSLRFEDYVGGLDAVVLEKTTIDSGKIGMSQYFNGSKLTLPDARSFDWEANASFTIQVWINKSSGCPSPYSINNNVIIGRDADSTGLHWWLGVSCSNPGKINFSLYSNDKNGLVLESKKGIIDGAWHLVSVVRDGEAGTSSIFIDGVLDTTAVFAYTDGFATPDSVNIGWLNLHNHYQYKGRLDELAIYNSALDNSVILNHYNTGLPYCTTFPTDTSDTDSSYTITLNFSGMTPVIGKSLNVYLNIAETTEALDSIKFDTIDSSEFTVIFDSLNNEANYHLDFWADMDSNKAYSAPPTDQAWRLELMNISRDTTISFAHNLNFTDIFDVGSDTAIVDTGKYQLTVLFEGFTDNIGQNLVVYLRETETGDLIDSTVIEAIDTSDFEIVFDSVSITNQYNIDFYSDVNGNGTYDIPPTDHAWRIPVLNVSADTAISFVYDTNSFVDIGLIVTGIDKTEDPGFTVYPNPAREELVINLEKDATDLAVYSVRGTVLLHRSLSLGERSVRLNITAFKPGIYILKVATHSGNGHKTFLKQ